MISSTAALNFRILPALSFPESFPITFLRNLTKLCAFVVLVTFWCYGVEATLTGDRWRDVANSTEYQQLPACAQSCVLQVDNSISCWSYGCVCSENTLGSNFNASLSNIASCATNNCRNDGGDVAVGEATDAFKQLCRLYYFTQTVSTVRTTATLTVNGTQTSVITVTTALPATPTPSATPAFRSEELYFV
jgi:CFEM domain